MRTALEAAAVLGLLVALVILALGGVAPDVSEPGGATGVLVVAVTVLGVGIAAAAFCTARKSNVPNVQ